MKPSNPEKSSFCGKCRVRGTFIHQKAGGSLRLSLGLGLPVSTSPGSHVLWLPLPWYHPGFLPEVAVASGALSLVLSWVCSSLSPRYRSSWCCQELRGQMQGSEQLRSEEWGRHTGLPGSPGLHSSGGRQTMTKKHSEYIKKHV